MLQQFRDLLKKNVYSFYGRSGSQVKTPVAKIEVRLIQRVARMSSGDMQENTGSRPGCRCAHPGYGSMPDGRSNDR
jgi:hypothetical protein